MTTKHETEYEHARRCAREALGPGYTRRLLAAYAVLVDGEGLLRQYAETGNYHGAHSEVCRAFTNLREAADLDF